MPGTSLVENDNMGVTTVRASLVLTTSFVAGATFNIQGANQLILLVGFTLGSSTGCQIKVEVGYTKTALFQIAGRSLAGGIATMQSVVHQLDASDDIVIEIPVWTRWCKISSKALTDGTNTLLAITALHGNV